MNHEQIKPTVASPDETKRQAILDSAVEVFAKQGFRQTDVQVIADRAGVGKGTVYRYFGNKQDLFWATTLALSDQVRGRVVAAMQKLHGPLDKLRCLATTEVEFFENRPELLELFLQERAEFLDDVPESRQKYQEEVFESLLQLVQEGIERGEIREIDTKAVLFGLYSVIYGSLVISCYVTNEDVVDLTRKAVDIFFEGLRP